MEGRLRVLFDYQRFQDNKRLEKLIADAEGSVSYELTDDELSLVAAAGEPVFTEYEDSHHDA